MKYRRIIQTLLLVLALVLQLGLPATGVSAADSRQEDAPYVFTEADNALIDNDVFAMIADVEAKTLVPRRGKAPTPEDYVKLLPQVIEAVKNSETYVEGSLVRNGDFIWWRTCNGMACCFDPYMEAIDHGWQDPEMTAEPEKPVELDVVRGNLKSATDTRIETSSAKPAALITPYWDKDGTDDTCLDANFKEYGQSYVDTWEDICEASGCSKDYYYALSNATIDNVAKCIEDCGLVIIYTHGWNDNHDHPENGNSSYISLTTQEGVTDNDMITVTGMHGEYCHAYKMTNGKLRVDGTCITNHMNKRAQDSFVYFASCLIMSTPGMFQPLRQHGVHTVYGYSRSVTFYGEQIYFEEIFDKIIDGNTVADAVAAAKKAHVDWDPCYDDWTLEEAQTGGKAFPIVVSPQDAYPGQANVQNVFTFHSNWTLIDPRPTLTGTVSITPASPVFGDKLNYILGGEAYTLQQSGVNVGAAWERSDNGETGWTAFTAGPTTITADCINKYLRARVSATGYAGYIYSSPVFVTKAPNKSAVAKAQLWGSGTQISVTNSQSNQEYLVLNYKKDIASLTASDWAAAKPGNGGSLTLNGTANSVNYVYTRLRETDVTLPGTVVVTSNIYLGESASLSGISLSYTLLDSDGNPKSMELDEMGTYYYAKAGDIVKITAEPVPSNTTFNGIRSNNWLVNSSSSNTTYGRYYTSSGCHEPLYTDRYYKTVYFKVEKQVNHLLLSAQYYYGYNSLAYDSFSLNVADSSGEYLFDSASAYVTVYVGGVVKDFPIKKVPDRADLTGATISYRGGTGTSAPAVTLNGDTVSVSAGKATGGSYYYDLYKNGSKLPGGVTVVITAPPVEELSLSPSMLTGHPGKSYTITPKFLPANSETPVTWSSSNPAVATVKGGVVTISPSADIAETATITATAGGVSASCLVTVFGQRFDLEIDGVQVTTDNMSDILGNGVFRFDGRETLTIKGSYSSANRIIENDGVDYLEIVAERDAVLTSTGGPVLMTSMNTTIRGPGRLTLNAPADSGIYVTGRDATLELQDLTMELNGSWGIAGPNGANGTKLVIDHASIAAKGPLGAVTDFGGGITITDSEIVKPQGGRISSDGASIADSAGAVSDDVLISALAINPFADVPEGQYYYEPVLWAVNHSPQITNGTSPTTFSPGATCTRAQVVTFLWRAMGQPEPTKTDNPFTDVKEGQYYYKAVLWALEKGITTGTSATTFSPNAGCTRGQVVTFLHRAQGTPTPGSSVNPFTDVKSGQYYYDAVLWAVNHSPQITNGTSATTFSPNATCTRGQIVTFLYRSMK